MSRIDHKFDLMYAKRAFVHHYVGEGWRRASSRRRVRISPPWRRTTRRSASRRRKARARRKGTVTSSKNLAVAPNPLLLLTLYARERLAHVFVQVFESREVAGVA